MSTLNSKQIIILSVSAGISVANVYYSQPILGAIAESFSISTENAGTLTVLSQVGYGLGLLLLTPVGDMMDRKKLILYLQLSLFAACMLMASAWQLSWIYVASLLLGVFSVVAQVILPMAASLVTENRGKVVATIFTGLLIGILLARMFSGVVTEAFGWRAVYYISGGLIAVNILLFQMFLPSVSANYNGSYSGLLRSTVAQLGRFSKLRSASFTGMLAFGTLCAFWVSLTLYLSKAPFNYSPSKIGLFGVLAVMGALLAPVFGKFADRGSSARSLLFSTCISLLSVVLLGLFSTSVFAIALATILLDVGVQATQVTNIAVIYSLDQTANSRINTVYMTSYFIGGGLGSFTAIQCFETGGWMRVVLLMLVLSVLNILNVLSSGWRQGLKGGRRIS